MKPQSESENENVLTFKVKFRPMHDGLNICDNCEIGVTAWYNELLATDYCMECMKEMLEDYKKNGGD